MKKLSLVFLLVSFSLLGQTSVEKPLELCQQKIEFLLQRAQDKSLFPVPSLLPEHSGWVEFAHQNLATLAYSERYRQASPTSPDIFLYSNAQESCRSFAEKFESQVNRWLFWEVMVGLGMVIAIGTLIYLTQWLFAK